MGFLTRCYRRYSWSSVYLIYFSVEYDISTVQFYACEDRYCTWCFVRQWYRRSEALCKESTPHSESKLKILLITQMSLIYMNTSNAIQQSLYRGGYWIESLVYQASTPPADDSRLSVFTRPALNFSEYSLPPDSVAVYQHNKSLVMIQVSPDMNVVRDPHVNYNSLSSITISQDLAYTDVGFACIVDQENPSDSTHMFLRCFVGDESFRRFGEVHIMCRAFSGIYLPTMVLDLDPDSEINRNSTWENYCKFISLRLFMHTCSD